MCLSTHRRSHEMIVKKFVCSMNCTETRSEQKVELEQNRVCTFTTIFAHPKLVEYLKCTQNQQDTNQGFCDCDKTNICISCNLELNNNLL